MPVAPYSIFYNKAPLENILLGVYIFIDLYFYINIGFYNGVTFLVLNDSLALRL